MFWIAADHKQHTASTNHLALLTTLFNRRLNFHNLITPYSLTHRHYSSLLTSTATEANSCNEEVARILIIQSSSFPSGQPKLFKFVQYYGCSLASLVCRMDLKCAPINKMAWPLLRNLSSLPHSLWKCQYLRPIMCNCHRMFKMCRQAMIFANHGPVVTQGLGFPGPRLYHWLNR